MRKTKEEKIEIVNGIEALIATGVKVDPACAEFGVSNPTFYTYRKELGLKPENPDKTPAPPAPEVYEETDAIIDALLEEPDNPSSEAVEEVVNNWIKQKDKLLEGETKAAELAGTLLDHCLFDIQTALGLAEDGE